MGTSIFLPKKINVGFQNRQDTYTSKLAYVTYFDEKGKLRKETSWNGWRDNQIDPIVYDNEPTEGFVLNKKAGGYSTGWNHRQTWVRVYDPRGFEFEITVTNLLFILENTNSIKGKGLEGEFVYGWDGKDLVLVPTDSPDYTELSKINAVIHEKNHITGRQLKIGSTYLTKDNKQVVYMGKYDEYGSYSGEKKKGKSFYFVAAGTEGDMCSHFTTIKTLGNKIISVIDDECVSNYADLFDKLECLAMYSPMDHSKDEYVPLTLEEFENKSVKSGWGTYIHLFIDEKYIKERLSYSSEEGYYYEIPNPNYSWRTGNNEPYKLKVTFKDENEVMEKLKPIRIRKYLENGKIYSEDYPYGK